MLLLNWWFKPTSKMLVVKPAMLLSIYLLLGLTTNLAAVRPGGIEVAKSRWFEVVKLTTGCHVNSPRSESNH